MRVPGGRGNFLRPTGQLGASLRVKSRWLVPLLLLILPLGLAGQLAPPPASRPGPPAEIEPLAQDFPEALVPSLGKQIYEQDQRVNTATEMARARGIDFAKEQVRGWIVVRDRAAERVRFMREENGGVVNAFEVAFVAGAVPQFQRLGGERLTEAEEGQFRARLRAISGIVQQCSALYGFAILDHPQIDAFLIYAVAKPTEPGSVVVGGHYRFVVSRDGQRGISAERLYRNCLTLPANASAGKQTEGVAITNLASERPLETHVYLSLLHRLPLFVATADGTRWTVDGLRVDPVRP